MDVLFVENVQFKLPVTDVMRCRVARSQEEVLRGMLELVGIELIDYGSFTVQPLMLERPRHLESWDLINCYSKAYRERVERDAMAHR